MEHRLYLSSLGTSITKKTLKLGKVFHLVSYFYLLSYFT